MVARRNPRAYPCSSHPEAIPPPRPPMPMRPALLITAALLAATPAAAQPERDRPVDTTLHPALLAQFRADAAANEEEANFLDLDSVPVPVVVYDRRDLNGDGRDEVFLSGLGRYCGASGNCPLWIYTPADNGGWRRIHAGAGLGVEVRRTKTNGFADLVTPSHFSAHETYRSGYAHDGRTYVWTGTTFHVSEDDGEREVFQVISPVSPARTDSLRSARTVFLRRVRVDSAGDLMLSADYTVCGTAASTEPCGAGRILLRAPGRPSAACHALYVAGFDDEFTQSGDRLCATVEGGMMVLRPSAAQWDAIYLSRTTELRSGGGTIRIADYARDALAAFVAGAYSVAGRKLPDPES